MMQNPEITAFNQTGLGQMHKYPENSRNDNSFWPYLKTRIESNIHLDLLSARQLSFGMD